MREGAVLLAMLGPLALEKEDAGIDDRDDEAEVVGGLGCPSAVVVLGGPRRRRLRQYVPTNLYSRGCILGLSGLGPSAMMGW